MREPMLETLLRLPLRQLRMLSAAVLLLAAAGAWLLLKAPASALVAARAERVAQAQAMETEQSLRLAADTLSGELARLSAMPAVAGGMAEGHADRLVVDALGQFHRLGARYQVKLNKLSPGTLGQVLMFEEIPFDVEITGGYANVVRWLLEAEQSLPMLSITQLDVRRLDASESVVMRARLSAYFSTEIMQ